MMQNAQTSSRQDSVQNISQLVREINDLIINQGVQQDERDPDNVGEMYTQKAYYSI